MRHFVFKKIFLCSVFIVLFSGITCAKIDKIDMKGLETNLMRHVICLSEEIGERNVFQYQKLEEAAEYILKQFESFGYAPETQDYRLDGKDLRNLIATKKGTKEPDEIIVVGAHYDTVYGSPGADDNASAVAGLLELARLTSKLNMKKTIKFVAFPNEEPPFFFSEDMGSRRYAKEARRRGDRIVGMICLESIGYYSEEKDSQGYPLGFGLFYPNKGNFIGVVGNLRSGWLVKDVVRGFKRGTDFPIVYLMAPSLLVPAISLSDHSSFWHYGYPAVMVTDTAFYRNSNYHLGSDTFETLNYKSMAEVIKGLYNVLIELGDGSP